MCLIAVQLHLDSHACHQNTVVLRDCNVALYMYPFAGQRSRKVLFVECCYIHKVHMNMTETALSSGTSNTVIPVHAKLFMQEHSDHTCSN